MNSKERILATLSNKPIDRIAIDLWHTPETGRLLKQHFEVTGDLDLYRAMKLDKIVWVFLDYTLETGEGLGAQAGANAKGSRTMWGAPLKTVQAGREYYEEFVSPPMASYEKPEEIDNYPYWPDPKKFDYVSGIRLAKEASRDFAVIGPWVSLFEVYCQLRGEEQSLIDLILNPALVEALLDRIEAIQTEMMKRFFDGAAQYLDLVFISDDVACQKGLLFSPELWRQYLQPRMVRWCKMIHSYGLKVFYHTDGAAEPLIQPLIDCGIDVLNPIQHVCPGMKPIDLKRKYGGQVIFHGGVDNQRILPFGTPDDVRREVQYLTQTLGGDKDGFICCSCHNVQANTPLENILAMVDAVKEHKSKRSIISYKPVVEVTSRKSIEA